MNDVYSVLTSFLIDSLLGGDGDYALASLSHLVALVTALRANAVSVAVKKVDRKAMTACVTTTSVAVAVTAGNIAANSAENVQ